MRLVPINLSKAKEFVQANHRHNPRVVGWKFGVGLEADNKLVGVGVAGRPVSRALDDGFTLEITRCCTIGNKNAPSMIYGALGRAAKALGFLRLVTYTLESEPGVSLKAAGWSPTATRAQGSWDTPSRRRQDKHVLSPRIRWERKL